MVYDSKNFEISRIEGGSADYWYLSLIAHNKSSIEITDVFVSFNQIKGKAIVGKWTERTSNILPGETRRIFHEKLSLYSLEITDITVHAADGTQFKVPPPSTTPPTSIGTKLILGIISLIIIFLALQSLGVFSAMETAKAQDEYYKINTDPFEISRVNETTIKIIYQGGKYKDTLESFNVFYTNPDGQEYIKFAKRNDGLFDYYLPKGTVPVGTIQYVSNVGSPISLELWGNLKGGLFEPTSYEMIYKGTV